MNSPDVWRRAAHFADRIFKGAKPAELPMAQPAKFDTQVSRTADKLKIGVAHQSARQQTGLTKDLKAVANAQHKPAALGEFDHTAQDRREACHGATAQIVAVGKPARQNNTIEVARQLILVPEQLDLLAQFRLERVKDVVIVARAGKSDDSPMHISTDQRELSAELPANGKRI